MKWYCNHDWSQWSELIEAYSGTYQYRKCLKCGKLKKRQVGYGIDGKPKHVNSLEFKKERDK